ncbi:hypothetical protein CGCTS75_v011557 [Colletotrichum tropicale]|nr:hypothetical protein CGCTS75_v011557 [Colletotrichum tropicale]
MHRIGRDETSKEEPLYPQLIGGMLRTPEYHGAWAMHRIGRDETSKEEPLYPQLTGGMLRTPEYHGAWAIELDSASRYVGAVSMEFIDGVSIEEALRRRG